MFEPGGGEKKGEEERKKKEKKLDIRKPKKQRGKEKRVFQLRMELV